MKVGVIIRTVHMYNGKVTLFMPFFVLTIRKSLLFEPESIVASAHIDARF